MPNFVKMNQRQQSVSVLESTGSKYNGLQNKLSSDLLYSSGVQHLEMTSLDASAAKNDEPPVLIKDSSVQKISLLTKELDLRMNKSRSQFLHKN